MIGLPPFRSWLYAPGNDPEILERVFTAGADAVILDLEDSVPPAEKERARSLVAEAVRRRAVAERPAVFVRVNGLATGQADDDAWAVVVAGLTGIRVPKVEHPEEVRRFAAVISGAERAAGLAPGSVALVCGIESAAGVEAASEIARADPRVATLSFGATDFIADIGGELGPAGLETLYARSRLVVACRAAGLVPPVESVHIAIDDDEGLERTTRASRALGLFGRACIHPRQLAIVHAVFTPTAAEIARAREIVAAARSAAAAGRGALRLPDGSFVDPAVVRRADLVLRAADAFPGAATEVER